MDRSVERHPGFSMGTRLFLDTVVQANTVEETGRLLIDSDGVTTRAATSLFIARSSMVVG